MGKRSNNVWLPQRYRNYAKNKKKKIRDLIFFFFFWSNWIILLFSSLTLVNNCLFLVDYNILMLMRIYHVMMCCMDWLSLKMAYHGYYTYSTCSDISSVNHMIVDFDPHNVRILQAVHMVFVDDTYRSIVPDLVWNHLLCIAKQVEQMESNHMDQVWFFFQCFWFLFTNESNFEFVELPVLDDKILCLHAVAHPMYNYDWNQLQDSANIHGNYLGRIQYFCSCWKRTAAIINKKKKTKKHGLIISQNLFLNKLIK